MRRGKSRQAARGHKVKEHIARREREAREGLTSYQRQAVKKFALEQAPRMDEEAEVALDIFREFADAAGWEAFKVIRDLRTEFVLQYRHERKKGTYVSRGISWLQGIAEDHGAEDVSWLYYH